MKRQKSVPSLIIISGPNGAGKTTFAREYLGSEGLRFEFVNADEIARRMALHTGSAEHLDIRAARIMIDRVNNLVNAAADLVIETTLANLTYASKIPAWRSKGYHVTLIYLRLNSATMSVERVRKRVESGGHNIPEETIRRRFTKSETYFETVYKPIVNTWHLWESREGEFTFIESSEQT